MNSTNIKVATVSPKKVYIGAPSLNAKYMAELVNSLEENTGLVIFPELSLTGYSCGDLFKEQTLIDSAQIALTDFMHLTKDSKKLICVGMPFVYKNKLYNCAVFVQNFKIIAVIPKTNLNIEEKKYFNQFNGNTEKVTVYDENYYYFGNKILLFDSYKNKITISCDIGNDLFAPISPNTIHSINGANLNINISAMKKTVSSESKVSESIKNHSLRCKNTYVYCSASCDESTADSVMSNQHAVYENGKKILDISENEVNYFVLNPKRNESIKNTLDSFVYIANDICQNSNYICADVIIENCKSEKIVSLMPFIPKGLDLKDKIDTILEIQSKGLATRLKKINCKKVVLGISGGSDSTLALLVAIEAFKRNNYDLKGIIGITMPCFGTSKRTKNNSIKLMEKLGITSRTIDITKAVKIHLENIGHPLDLYDITYENAQARERTQVLMDIANYENALVVGTGDLSELALGWCTYNGDHMSMYSVNSSIPKTLVKFIISEYRDRYVNDDVKNILTDILDTPVSPELLPLNKDGTISQITENSIGSYLIHDFVLYYMMKYKLKPSEIYELYINSQLKKLSIEEKREILKNMELFYKRFFTQQFKRNCLPDGPSIGSINFSPRNNWNMPSDASYEEWIKDLDKLKKER